jgi:hypothetical protein
VIIVKRRLLSEHTPTSAPSCCCYGSKRPSWLQLYTETSLQHRTECYDQTNPLIGKNIFKIPLHCALLCSKKQQHFINITTRAGHIRNLCQLNDSAIHSPAVEVTTSINPLTSKTKRLAGSRVDKLTSCTRGLRDEIGAVMAGIKSEDIRQPACYCHYNPV